MQQYIRQDGRFDDTSVWVLGERRLVTLMGCVQSPEQGRALEQAVGLVDDVMGVVNQLSVGTAPPAERTPPQRPLKKTTSADKSPDALDVWAHCAMDIEAITRGAGVTVTAAPRAGVQ